MRITIRRLRSSPIFIYRLLIPTLLVRRYNLWQYGRLYEKTRSIRNARDNGVYHFLGNFHQHMSHTMPLYKFIGGTVVVLSASAKKEVEKYGVRCICIDDNKEIWLNLDKNIQRTINFLDRNAKIVILYDAFYWHGIELRVPTLWLSHGVSVKGVIWDKERFKQLNKLTIVATLGGIGKDILDKEVEPQRMRKLSSSRTDEVVGASVLHGNQKSKIKNTLKLPANKTIITYMPTYWGPSSVEDIGLEIIKNISDDKVVIFWPHPQTPKEIIKKYEKIIKNRRNIIDAQKIKDVDITDIYTVTDTFITDHSSSVVADMMLLNKPIFFAFGRGDNYDHTITHSPLRRLVKNSINITTENVNEINSLLDSSDTMLAKFLRRFLSYRFTWFPNGGATAKIIATIDEIGFPEQRLLKNTKKSFNDDR